MASSSNNKEMVVISSGEEEEEDEGQPTIYSSSEDEPEDPNLIYLKTIAVNMKKRMSEEETSTNEIAKRAKKKNSRRLFTKEDDIVLLKGMLDFKTVSSTADGFYDSVKKSISFDMTKAQFNDKIRNLKSKYMSKANGVKPCFLNPHDKKCLELSKRIWGSEGLVVGESSDREKSKTKTTMADSLKQVLPSLSKGKKVVDDGSNVLIHGRDHVELPKSNWFEKSFLVQSIGLDEHLVKKGWSKVPIETKKKIEEELKLLEKKEIDCAVLISELESQKKNLLHE